MFTPKIITVSQLNFYVKSLLDNDSHLNFVFLEGEISNLTDHYSSGHLYFSLKDSKSVVKAVMFSQNARMLKFKPKTGMKVILRGRVTVYEPTGQYQVYVEDMQPDGIGALSLQFEQLKETLSKEGLFDSKHKKPIPVFPKTLGIITSPTGAAVQDILNISRRRFPGIDIVMYPVLVQGDNAPSQLIKAINTFSKSKAADVIIIGRGGGSAEDLWAFNDEGLARAIYDCSIPVISAVGHETDFTICDFVSDLRAPTPSAAAELAVPDAAELLASINSQRQYIDSIIDNKISMLQRSLYNYSKLITAYSPEKLIKLYADSIITLSDRAVNASKYRIDSYSQKTFKIASKLEALNPISVLKRGFSYVSLENKNVSSVKFVSVNDDLNIRLADGEIIAKVTEINSIDD